MGALLGAGKRLLTGESLFMTVFLNRSRQKRKVAFGAPYPGKIVPIHLAEIGGELIAQKDSFLAAAKGVSRRHRVSAQARGRGCSAARGSSCSASRVTAGRSCTPAAPCWSGRSAPAKSFASTPAASSPSSRPSQYDIQFVGKIKSAFFGGEGLFFATLRGPGRVWLQSLPLSRLANRINAAAPGVGRGGREEGSLLGGLGGLLDGDNS